MSYIFFIDSNYLLKILHLINFLKHINYSYLKIHILSYNCWWFLIECWKHFVWIILEILWDINFLNKGDFPLFYLVVQFEFQIIAFKEILFCILSCLLVDLAKILVLSLKLQTLSIYVICKYHMHIKSKFIEFLWFQMWSSL